jgi:hypothetical protein
MISWYFDFESIASRELAYSVETAILGSFRKWKRLNRYVSIVVEPEIFYDAGLRPSQGPVSSILARHGP